MKLNTKNNKAEFYKVYKPLDASILHLAEALFSQYGFFVWSGSGYEGQHHYGYKGLCTHTLEVVKVMFSSAEALQCEVNKDVMFLAALYHDIGKVFDYKYIEDPDPCSSAPLWVPTDHKRNIHHISKSAMIFFESANKVGLDVDLREEILHCILSHHTTRAYGSPVAPNSREAWLLTLADNTSARMDDCGTWDYIKKK
jgi:3'-5' exoribonuclease